MKRAFLSLAVLVLLLPLGGWEGCLTTSGQGTALRHEFTPPLPAQADESFADPAVHRRFGLRLLWQAEIPLHNIEEWWLEPNSIYAMTRRDEPEELRLFSVSRADGTVKWQIPLPQPIHDRPHESVSVTKHGAEENVQGYWLIYEMDGLIYGIDISPNDRTGEEVGEMRWMLDLDEVADIPANDGTTHQEAHFRQYSTFMFRPYEGYPVIGSDPYALGDAPLSTDYHRRLHRRRSAMVMSSPLAVQYREPTRMFVGSYDNWFYAIELPTPELITRMSMGRAWKYMAESPTTARPLALDDHVFFSTDMGDVFAIRAKSGQRAWVTPFTRQVGARVQIGASREYLFVASEDYNLYAVNRLGGSLDAVFRSGMPLRNAPQGLGSRAYFRDDEGMFYCLNVASTVDDGAMVISTDPNTGREKIKKRFWWPQPSREEGRPWVWRIRGGQRILAVGQSRLMPRVPRTIYLLKDGNTLAAINDDSGEVYWEYPIDDFSHPLMNVFAGEEPTTPYLFLADSRRGMVYCFVEDHHFQREAWQEVVARGQPEVRPEIDLRQAVEEIRERDERTLGPERRDTLYDEFEARLRRLRLLPPVPEAIEVPGEENAPNP